MELKCTQQLSQNFQQRDINWVDAGKKKRTVQIEAKTNGSVPALTDETLLSAYPPI
jgi:hypothetical protein